MLAQGVSRLEGKTTSEGHETRNTAVVSSRVISSNPARLCSASEQHHVFIYCTVSVQHAQYCYYIHLMAFFSRTTWVSRYQKGKPFWILLEQEMTGWQWHQLDHMQIICASLQADNHASYSPLILYRLDALPATQPTASKH